MKRRLGILRRRLFRQQAGHIAIATALLLSGVIAIALASSNAVQADHNSMYLVCPDPILEGNSGQMSVRRPGYRVVYATIFTHHGDYTAQPNDFVEYHGVKLETSSDDKILRVPIVTKEDALPEHDETFSIGFMNDGVWHSCLVTIEDDDAPEITSVDISSIPADRYAYRAGESIDVMVGLDVKADVEDAPRLSFYIGDGEDNNWRGAEYHSGTGSRNLVFRYEVQPEDMDSDGFSVGSSANDDSRNPAYGFTGNIFAAGTDVPINYAQPGLKSGIRHKVDGRPYVQQSRIISSPPDGWDSYRANQVIELSMTFDTDVLVEGDVSVELYLGLEDYDWEQAKRHADYIRGSGTDTLVFGYTVRPGDMDPRGVGLMMGTDRNGFVGSGTIKAKGTDVDRNPYYRGTNHQPDHKVDTAPPALSAITFASRPDNDVAYLPGEAIKVEVTFSEKVTAIGDLQLELDIGGVMRQATMEQVPNRTYTNSLLFSYEVQAGDSDSDGIGIGANRLKVLGGGIFDSAGNAANLSHSVLPADPDQIVGRAVSTGSQ